MRGSKPIRGICMHNNLKKGGSWPLQGTLACSKTDNNNHHLSQGARNQPLGLNLKHLMALKHQGAHTHNLKVGFIVTLERAQQGA